MHIPDLLFTIARHVAPWLPFIIAALLIAYAICGRAAALEEADRQFGDWPGQRPTTPPTGKSVTLHTSSRAARRLFLCFVAGIPVGEALFYLSPLVMS